MIDLDEIQTEHNQWQRETFPAATAEDKLLGLVEEVGELCHAHTKGKQQNKYTPDQVQRMKKDAAGDIFFFLLGFCSFEGIPIEDVINDTWQEVRERKYEKLEDVENPLRSKIVISDFVAAEVEMPTLKAEVDLIEAITQLKYEADDFKIYFILHQFDVHSSDPETIMQQLEEKDLTAELQHNVQTGEEFFVVKHNTGEVLQKVPLMTLKELHPFLPVPYLKG